MPWSAVAALWLLAVVSGLWVLNAYKATPGQEADAPDTWQAGAAEGWGPPWRLLVFLHPRCPCSRATVAELARLMAESGGRLDCRVWFVRPDGLTREEPPLWRAAAAIPGVRVSWDDGGTEARRFGARTSGQVLLYDPAGALRFEGGITPSRGHEGESPGRDAIRAWLEGGGGPARAEVFGCPLFEPPAE